MRRTKGRKEIAPKPTCAGPRSYRTSRPNPANFQHGVCSQGDSTGGSGEGVVAMRPSEKTSGGRIFGLHDARAAALMRSAGEVPYLSPHPDMRLSGGDHGGATCGHLRKMVWNHDR